MMARRTSGRLGDDGGPGTWGDIFPRPRLYDMCRKARRLSDKWRIGRVIAVCSKPPEKTTMLLSVALTLPDRGRRDRGWVSAPREGEEVGVEPVLMGLGEAVRRPLVDLQGRACDDL